MMEEDGSDEVIPPGLQLVRSSGYEGSSEVGDKGLVRPSGGRTREYVANRWLPNLMLIC